VTKRPDAPARPPGPEGRDLEAALLASWDRDTLAVYADHLQSLGDPRGELIALDLQLEQRATHELVERRTSLLSAWLGGLAPSDPHGSWIGDSFRLGFVEDLVIACDQADAEARLAAVLTSPLGPYCRRVTIRGEVPAIERVLARLADVRHDWLRWLAVRRSPTYDPTPACVDAAVVERFVAAAPHLDVLELHGARVLDAFPHPGLRRLRLTGWSALPAVFDRDAPLASICELDLAFDDPEQRAPRDVLPAVHLPGLRRLDLARNEPRSVRDIYDGGYDDGYDTIGDGFDEDEVVDTGGAIAPTTALGFLASLAHKRQLTHLRLPSLRSEAEFRQLAALVADMPALVDLELARGHYYRPPDLPHPARFQRAAAWPWPPLARLTAGECLEIVVPDSRSADTVSLADAVRIMEQRFDDLPADARYAWTRLWVTIAPLGPQDEPTFPAEILVAALESCEIATGGWRQLRDELRYRRPLAPHATVTISRSRG
jgi:hypothetical protein